MSALPSFFGPLNGLDSKDYLLYMTAPGQSPVTRPVKLLAHSLTSPNQNLIDAVLFTTVEESGGEIRVVSRVKRAAQETSRTYTLGLPSAIWTPVQEQALLTKCSTTFFMIYLCPSDDIYAHWYILPESFLNPPTEAEDVITTGEETNILTMTTDLQTPRRLTGYGLNGSIIYDATVLLNDIAFTVEDCKGCSGGVAQKLVAGGGDGVAIPLAIGTSDRFSSISTYVTGAAATHVITAIYRKNDFIIVAEKLAAVGALRVSYDGGTTWSAVAGYAEIVNEIIDVDGTLVFVGGDGTGGAVAISSDLGQTVTAITSTAIPAAAGLNGVAYDKITGKLYIVGDSGTLLSGRFSGSTLSLSDISANLAGTPGALFRVVVRDAKEIVVGGAAGYLAESHDSALTFTEMAFNSASAVKGLAGNLWRLVVGAGTKVYEQTALTNYEIVELALENGVTLTGNITRARMNLNDDFNRYALCTDDGQIAILRPFYPNA